MHSEPNKSFVWRKKLCNSIGASGAAGSDVIELIKKDWAMTQSFVLICMKIRQKKLREKNEKIAFLSFYQKEKEKLGYCVLCNGVHSFLSFFQRRKIEIRFRLYQGMEKMWLLKSNSQSQIRRLVWGKTSPGPIQSSSNVKQNRKNRNTK